MENNLQNILRRKNMSQGELARRCGIERPYINRIARDLIHNVTIRTALKISRALAVPVELIWSLPD